MMNTNLIALASELPDHDLLARIAALAAKERGATVELVAHLAALASRPSLYASEGYGSLFTYCTHVLHLSEDAACNRIHAARACRRFPVILDLLATGKLSLTSVRMLRKHLTPENHEAVLARANGRSRPQIEALVAELAPRPDAQPSVRKLPAAPVPAVQLTALPISTGAPERESSAEPGAPNASAALPPLPTVPPIRRPVIETTAPERYRVQFTVGKETHDKLRRLQALLRREIPDGDPGAIFERAVTLLLAKVESKKMGVTAKPRESRSIRPGTDSSNAHRVEPRDIPAYVRREVWRRDGGQCGYIGPGGHRCPERTFLEFHHIVPYARGGCATVDNISLRCRRHNQYEAELEFPATVMEAARGNGRRSPSPTPAAAAPRTP
jgi:5-methylcytosine-specific restriction endonuclease McrA